MVEELLWHAALAHALVVLSAAFTSAFETSRGPFVNDWLGGVALDEQFLHVSSCSLQRKEWHAEN